MFVDKKNSKRFVKFYYNKSFYKTIRPKYSDSTIFFSNSAIYEQMMEIGSKWANEQHVFDNIWTGEEEISLQSLMHTVAIWTFTFHKKSGFVKVILKANFNPG